MIIILSLELLNSIVMTLDGGGVIEIGEGLMSETMRMIANKRLQEIHSLFHNAFLLFFSLTLSRLLHKRKLVSRLWRHFRMTGASDEVITEQLC